MIRISFLFLRAVPLPMPLQIIGAGYGRTGTLSTYTALNQLGFPCYHMSEVLENPQNKSHLDFWNQVANSATGQQHDWEEVFSNYRATVDNPGCAVWNELWEAYPQAKVLVTLHPKGAEGWYESAYNTIYFTRRSWQFKLLSYFTPFARKMRNMTNKLIWQRSHQGTMEDKQAAIDRYNAHIEEVKMAVPADRLLLYSVDQGWSPLCEFLGVEIPDKPFPRMNDRAAMKKDIAKITRGAYVIIGIGAVVLLGVIVALRKLLG